MPQYRTNADHPFPVPLRVSSDLPSQLLSFINHRHGLAWRDDIANAMHFLKAVTDRVEKSVVGCPHRGDHDCVHVTDEAVCATPEMIDLDRILFDLLDEVLGSQLHACGNKSREEH